MLCVLWETFQNCFTLNVHRVKSYASPFDFNVNGVFCRRLFFFGPLLSQSKTVTFFFRRTLKKYILCDTNSLRYLLFFIPPSHHFSHLFDMMRISMKQRRKKRSFLTAFSTFYHLLDFRRCLLLGPVSNRRNKHDPSPQIGRKHRLNCR